MERIALQWAVASSLVSAYGCADRELVWRVAGEIAADCPQDPAEAGRFYASVFSVDTAEKLGVSMVA